MPKCDFVSGILFIKVLFSQENHHNLDWTFNKVFLLCKHIQFRKVLWNGGFQIFGVVKMEMAHWLCTDRPGKPRDMKVIFFQGGKDVFQVYFSFLFQGVLQPFLKLSDNWHGPARKTKRYEGDLLSGRQECFPRLL